MQSMLLKRNMEEEKPAKEHEGHIENLLFEDDGQLVCIPIKTCLKDLSTLKTMIVLE